MNIQSLLLIAPPILLALTFHEYAHAYVAHRYGDDTAQKNGRLSLNPLRHLDPLGTIMIFLVQFGWAKPVPVNPYNLRNPKKDMLWISAAGPLSNMFLAFVSGLLFRLFSEVAVTPERNTIAGLMVLMVFLSMKINLALAIFNILPIAPLDGSKILYGILPPRFGKMIFALERYGPFILIGLIIFGRATGVSILGGLIWPFVDFFSHLFAGI
ncbi:FIG004556: membrane metalloprotease [Olavius sp. associated proteobacterium Delta 1]|nr:FIG004556: membrane metalloprotease [Olavius sp. associated proteobacterium Delta 1]